MNRARSLRGFAILCGFSISVSAGALADEIGGAANWSGNPDWWVAGFTGALFVATTGLWFATWRLWKATNRAVSDSAKGLEIAEQSLKHAREASEQELRAYVVHYSADLFYGGNMPKNPQVDRSKQAAVSLVVKNEGKTPAHKMTHWAAIDVANINDENRMYILRDPKLESRPMVMPPQGTTTAYRWLCRDISPQEEAGINAGTHAIYAYGRIEYEDAFGKVRWTNYRLRYTQAAWPPLVTTAMSMNFCAEGNDAN